MTAAAGPASTRTGKTASAATAVAPEAARGRPRGRRGDEPPDPRRGGGSARAQRRRGGGGWGGEREQRLGHLQPRRGNSGGVIREQFDEPGDLLMPLPERGYARERRRQGPGQGYQQVVTAPLVRPLMGQHRGELGLVQGPEGGRGEHDLPPRPGQAPGRGLVMVHENGAEPPVMAPGQREHAAVTAAGQPRAGQRTRHAPGDPADHSEAEQRPGAG